MPQSLAQIYVHMVFSTKNRRPWLHSDDLRDQLYAYMTFQDEFRELCRRHGLELDERYAWD